MKKTFDHRFGDLHARLRSRQGQSLIEVMVAMTLLTVGFLGAVALLSRSLALNSFTANNVTAVYLASEGIEVTKNLIDHDVFAGNAGQGAGWGTCLSEIKTPQGFEVDYTTSNCNLLSAYSPTHFLYYDHNTHLYSYVSINGTPTIFTREISMGSYSQDEITVSSTVFWAGLDGAPQHVTLEDHFYNWYSNTSQPAP
jgi:prepilin-type N-terminal cleavage/methylation domain-containing protein